MISSLTSSGADLYDILEQRTIAPCGVDIIDGGWGAGQQHADEVKAPDTCRTNAFGGRNTPRIQATTEAAGEVTEGKRC